ncbi:MAG TPA: HD domain-containing phosphohydrolase, partial [Gemmatimonadaceae bacterium]|nr:HD domain-containing phosphohydrolase [Gemmatimonadaceae bacterium]
MTAPTGRRGAAAEQLPARFLNSFAQALSTMVLYGPGHPARERAVGQSYGHLRALQEETPTPQFSFLGGDVIFGERALRELKDWDWGVRLANTGIQRLEVAAAVERDDYEAFLEDALSRLSLVAAGTAAARAGAGGPRKPGAIRFGAVGVRGTAPVEEARIPTATITYSLGEEAETLRWVHEEVEARGRIPLLEAEAVVRSLSVAMHADSAIVIPLVQLKEFDQYTTTHSLNVSVLAMALAEYLGLGAKDVRAYGVAGLLHDLGKVRIPKEVLNKPGKLTDAEWAVMRRHPSEGARMIVESDRGLDLAAVVAYEHHIMLDGGGYPGMHFCRECHHASRLVHVCDVYDALRTKRPYREAWDAERALKQIEQGAGTDFDPDLVRAFSGMMREWERREAEVGDDVASEAGRGSGVGAVDARPARPEAVHA